MVLEAPSTDELHSIRKRTEKYLTTALLPFWITQSPDPQFGGFLTYFDASGRPTGETEKTFLMQIRMLYTMSSAHRAGYGNGECAALARMGAQFLLDHYWDNPHGGWIWIADRSGRPVVVDKVGYGQCFAIYAFSEYFLATGDQAGLEAAESTWRIVSDRMADHEHGGYFELMERDWTLKPGGRKGGDRKSFDVHMHMMEALTSFFEADPSPSVRASLIATIELIRNRMLDPNSGAAWMQFALDFEPLPAILFDTQWGRDAVTPTGDARPLDTTSYGHNVEFAWLLLHASDILGLDDRDVSTVVVPMFDHCIRHGIDWEVGGVFVDGAMDGGPMDREKQFWQQAEVLVGMLDALRLTNDPKYWAAFMNVYDFVFEHFVVPGVGEWYERVDRMGNPIDDALGHSWKISYHTVRSMIQTVVRLERLLSPNNRFSNTRK